MRDPFELRGASNPVSDTAVNRAICRRFGHRRHTLVTVSDVGRGLV
jgi:hypothetical protein